MTKAESIGDPQFLRMRNKDLSTRLCEVEEDNRRLKGQLDRPSSRSKSFSTEPQLREGERIEVVPDVDLLLSREERGQASTEGGGPRRASPQADPVVMRPPLRGTSRPVPSTRTPVPVGQDLEDQLSQQIAALVASRKELRERKRRDKMEQIPSQATNQEVSLGKEKSGKPQRAMPRIVEDVVLVPARSTPMLDRDFPPLGQAMQTTEDGWTKVLSNRRKKSQMSAYPQMMSVTGPFEPAKMDLRRMPRRPLYRSRGEDLLERQPSPLLGDRTSAMLMP